MIKEATEFIPTCHNKSWSLSGTWRGRCSWNWRKSSTGRTGVRALHRLWPPCTFSFSLKSSKQTELSSCSNKFCKLTKHYKLQQSVYTCLMLFHFFLSCFLFWYPRRNEETNTQKVSSITCPLRICSLDLLHSIYFSELLKWKSDCALSVFITIFWTLFD